jgi:hypothetical protein
MPDFHRDSNLSFWHLNFDTCLPAPPSVGTGTGRQGFGSLIFFILCGKDFEKLLLGMSVHQSLLEGRFLQQGDNATQ